MFSLFVTRSLTVFKGLKYKYSAAVPTMPFSEAPAVIIEALNKMSWVNETAQEGDAVKPLNEALSLGYFEEQAIHVRALTSVVVSPWTSLLMVCLVARRWRKVPRAHHCHVLSRLHGQNGDQNEGQILLWYHFPNTPDL